MDELLKIKFVKSHEDVAGLWEFMTQVPASSLERFTIFAGYYQYGAFTCNQRNATSTVTLTIKKKTTEKGCLD